MKPETFATVRATAPVLAERSLAIPATPAILEAWEEAYGVLADVFIATESGLYAEAAARPGGWRGGRDFVGAHRRPESEVVTTFYLAPRDGGPIADYAPGQYIIAVDVPDIGLQQIRQYSLSDAPGGTSYRISVKREAGTEAQTAGNVSNLLHDRLHPVDRVRITPPFGRPRPAARRRLLPLRACAVHGGADFDTAILGRGRIPHSSRAVRYW